MPLLFRFLRPSSISFRVMGELKGLGCLQAMALYICSSMYLFWVERAVKEGV